MSASRSARISLSTASPATNAASGFAQCVTFPVATSITFPNYGMNFWVSAATLRDGSVSATAEIRLFAAVGCSGFLSGAVSAAQPVR